jgi:hypothetical protein
MSTRLLTAAIAAAAFVAAGAPVVIAQPSTAVVPDEPGTPVPQAGGMPAVHDLPGEEFGRMMSELARSSPGAVAAHVRALTPAPPTAASEAAGTATSRAADVRRDRTAPGDDDDLELSELEQWPPNADTRRSGPGRP